MNAPIQDVLTRHPVPRHRLSVQDYHRLGESGVLSEDDRVELLEGQLVAMSPIGPPHAYAVDMLTRLLVPACPPDVLVRVQHPVVLGPATEPQPDITIVRRPWRGYPRAHPGPDDVLLLVEVADSSLGTDAGAKLEIYARAAIREYWIVDLAAGRVRVHREPDAGAYLRRSSARPPGVLEISALPGVAVPAAELFF